MQRIPRTTLVYDYERGRPPVATLESGDTVLVETKTAFGEAELIHGVEVVGPPPGRADPLTGPIHVTGSEVGDAVAVHIRSIDLVGEPAIGPMRGVSAIDWGAIPLEVLPVTDGQITVAGLSLAIRPMIGCIAVSPVSGTTPTTSVGDHGGNLDTKHIVAGATVMLPVFEPGAGLVLGDIHALQGDGEMTGSPPETDAEVTITVEVIKALALERPRVVTDARFMTLASAETLEGACRLAIADMVAALVEQTTLTADQVYVLLTLCADLEISQIVNSWVTVRVAVDRAQFGL
jgi:amidase